MKKWLSVPLALPAVLLTACQSAPLSYLTGNPDQPLPPHEHGIRIAAVDQQLYFSGPVQVAPGEHAIVFELPLPQSQVVPQKTVTMKIAPCTRYVFVGYRESLVKPEFEVKTKREEPVAGCSPEEEWKKASMKTSMLQSAS